MAIDRLGKRVVVRFVSGDRLLFEPRMTGMVLLDRPPTAEHVRLIIELRCGCATHRLQFWDRRGLGKVRWLDERAYQQWIEAAIIGPDALSITSADLRERLKSSSRPIKVALLDQQVLAGVGNLYASELLHLARLDPRSPCQALTDADWKKLHRAMRQVLLAAIRFEGSTLSDGTYRNALNQPGSYQNHHRVYDRAGQRCPTCRHAAIQRIVQAQRSTFLCPRCQAQRVGGRRLLR